MLVPGLDLARIETSFSGESILLDSGEYLSTGANSSVADLEGQGEPYIYFTDEKSRVQDAQLMC